MARRYKSLHHNLQPGQNVVFHREHISPRNRHKVKVGKLQKHKRSSRRKFKAFAKTPDFFAADGKIWGKRRRY